MSRTIYFTLFTFFALFIAAPLTCKKKKKERKKKMCNCCRALTSGVCSHHLVHAVLGSISENYSKCLWNICLCSDLGKFLKVILKRRHKVSTKFHPEKKATLFFLRARLFPQSLPTKQSPHVCWQLKIGLSARGNAQAQSHYQTKLSSDVEPVYFWGVKSEAFLLFVIGGWDEGWERRD